MTGMAAISIAVAIACSVVRSDAPKPPVGTAGPLDAAQDRVVGVPGLDHAARALGTVGAVVVDPGLAEHRVDERLELLDVISGPRRTASG